MALLERGQQRFDIYCAPCHSRVGDGNGMIVQRGFPHPPSYYTDYLQQGAEPAFLRRDHQRLWGHVPLCGTGDARRPLGDHRLYPGVAGERQTARLADMPADKRQSLQ